ncbi:MAG: WhiB family transcriptional regulator [Actinomycetota bacterium]|nr:WhiB family transcriptional regulator [Actinomycetota bacterium]
MASILDSNYKELPRSDDRCKIENTIEIGRAVCPDADDWQKLAACRGVATEVFFSEDDATVEDAKSICFGCSVARQCLEHAVDSREEEGIWGGATGAERRSLIRRRRRAKAKQRQLRRVLSSTTASS